MALTRPPAGLGLLRALASRRCQRWLVAAALALALAATLDGLQWLRVQRWNVAIAALAANADGPLHSGATGAAPATGADKTASNTGGAVARWGDPAAVPEWQFAQAHALAARGHGDAALHGYGRLVADPALGAAARFNSANLLLRQGQVLRAGAQPGQALALIELAKEGLRELLRADPTHWPARYNLERAQRLVPDPESTDDEPMALPRDAERAATTMRGDSPGLP